MAAFLVSAGTQISSYGSQGMAPGGLLESLMGQGGGYTSSYSTGGIGDLMGGLYGGSSSGGSTGSILDLFMGRSMTAGEAAEYIMENHFDASSLVWQNGRINLSAKDWSLTESLVKNVFVDNGSGFIDLGDAGVADKWRDLALCYRSLKHNTDGFYGYTISGFRPEKLFDELGIAPDWEKLRYYILLDEFF